MLRCIAVMSCTDWILSHTAMLILQPCSFSLIPSIKRCFARISQSPDSFYYLACPFILCQSIRFLLFCVHPLWTPSFWSPTFCPHPRLWAAVGRTVCRPVYNTTNVKGTKPFISPLPSIWTGVTQAYTRQNKRHPGGDHTPVLQGEFFFSYLIAAPPISNIFVKNTCSNRI